MDRSHIYGIFIIFLIYLSFFPIVVVQNPIYASSHSLRKQDSPSIPIFCTPIDDPDFIRSSNFEFPQFEEANIDKWKRNALKTDQNFNGINDNLEEKLQSPPNSNMLEENSGKTRPVLSGKQIINGFFDDVNKDEMKILSEHISVIMNFPQGNINSVICLFKLYGGTIKTIYDSAINGFAGSININGLNELCEVLRRKNVPFLVEEDDLLEATLYLASRNMNLRPFVWNTLSYSGDPNGAIAIIDTGIDDTHSSFTPGYSSGNFNYKIVGWRDEVSGYASPYDDAGHGSHCAGIAAGLGSPTLDGNGRTVGTFSFGFDYFGFMIPDQTITIIAAVFNVTQPGIVEIPCTFSDLTPGTDDIDASVYLYQDTTLVDSYSSQSASWSYSLSYTATAGTLGEYSFRITLHFDDQSGDGWVYDPRMGIRGEVHWPYNPPLLGGGDPWKGVAPDTHLVGVKVLDREGSGTLSDILDGVNWAINNKNTYHITTISMSLGGSAGQTSLINAVNNAVNNGIVTVVAAGNDGAPGNNVGSPGDADNVITVAAMTYDDHITEYSSSGGSSYGGFTTKPDIAAPGGSDYASSMFSTDSNDNDANGQFSTDAFLNDLAPSLGTSMATPAVAGAANLLIQAMGGYQNWNYTDIEAKSVKALLLMTATETYPLTREVDVSYSPVLNRFGKDIHEGYGRINIDAAIEAFTQKLDQGDNVSAWLSSSASDPFKKHALGCYLDLINGQTYEFQLQVPIGSDFDLLLFDSSPSSIGEPQLINMSINTGLGNDESIYFIPPQSGRYYLVIKAVSGEGNAILKFASNEFGPILTNGSISPPTGNQLTEFNFSVVFSDLDDNPPVNINTLINSSSYPMNKLEAGDNNYKDGCTYQYITNLQPGIYNYSFECFDGEFYNNSGPFPFLLVNESNLNPPSLSLGQVNPGTGDNSTTIFTYTVNYIDADNNAPDYVDVVINSSSHTMVQQDLMDTNYTDGCLFTYSTSLDTIGTYTFQFNCSDGIFFANIGPYVGPQVISQIFWNQTRLDGLRIGTVITHGEDNPRLIYPSIITELVQRGATVTDISTIIDAAVLANYDLIWFDEYGSSMAVNEIDAIEQWVQGGGRFIVTGDNMGSAINLAQRFNIFYSGSPPSGITSTIYPHPITLGVNQVYFPSPMTALDLSSQPGATLCVESSGFDMVTAMEFGSGRFVIIIDEDVLRNLLSADNHLLINNSFGWLGNIRNDYAPTLTSAQVSPPAGNQSTLFTFSVVYSDLDNNGPSSIIMLLNGSLCPLVKQNPLDNNYVDGCIFQYSTYLPPESYIYTFNCSDGKFFNSTGLFVGLIVNSTNEFTPMLMNPQVIPANGNNSTLFSYTVDYYDTDNNLPEFVNISINDSVYLMQQSNGSDQNAMDGLSYKYETTLDFGFYRFQINCSDSKFTSGTNWINGPEVNPFYGLKSGKIVINEICANPDFIEFYNYGEDRDMTGWTVQIYHGISLDNTYTFPAGWTFHEGFVVVLHELSGTNTDTNLYTGWNIPWVNSPIAVGLFDEMGYHMDWIQTSSFTGSKPADVEWVQDTSININNNYAYRTSDTDTDQASDWIVSASGSQGSLNPGQTGQTETGAIVTLLSPPGGSIRFQGTITFTWRSLQLYFGAVNYTLQISNTPDFSNIIEELNGIEEIPSHTSIAVYFTSPTGIYYWRVHPTFENFHGNWSNSKTFIIIGGIVPPGSGLMLILAIVVGLTIGCVATAALISTVVIVRKRRRESRSHSPYKQYAKKSYSYQTPKTKSPYSGNYSKTYTPVKDEIELEVISTRPTSRERVSPIIKQSKSVIHYLEADLEHFSCSTCKSIIDIGDTAYRTRIMCNTCGEPVKRILRCSNCHHTKAISQADYLSHLRKRIKCPKCNIDSKSSIMKKGSLLNNIEKSISQLTPTRYPSKTLKRVIPSFRYLKLDPEHFTCLQCGSTLNFDINEISNAKFCIWCGEPLYRIMRCSFCNHREAISQKVDLSQLENKMECQNCKVQNKSKVDKIITDLKDENRAVRFQALKSIVNCGDKKVIPALISVLLFDQESSLRALAAITLGIIGGSPALHVLRNVMHKDPNIEVRRSAARAIVSMRKQGLRD